MTSLSDVCRGSLTEGSNPSPPATSNVNPGGYITKSTNSIFMLAVTAPSVDRPIDPLTPNPSLSPPFDSPASRP